MYQEDEKKLSMSPVPYRRIHTIEVPQFTDSFRIDFHKLMSTRDLPGICAYFTAYDFSKDIEDADKAKLDELLQQQNTKNLHFLMTALLHSNYSWKNPLTVQRNFYSAVPEMFIRELENLLNQDMDVGVVMHFIENNKKLFLENYMSLFITEEGFKTLVETLDILSALKEGFKEDVEILYNLLHKYREKSQISLLQSFFCASPENKYRYFYLKLTERFLRRYCNPAISGGLEREIKCQILFLDILAKDHDFKRFWFSFNLMSDIFLGQGHETSSVPQQKKLTEMLLALSKRLSANLTNSPKFNAIPNVFIYLAVCLLKHRQFFSLYGQTNLEPFLKIIASWEDVACITFAEAILVAPLTNSSDSLWLKTFMCSQLSRKTDYKVTSEIKELIHREKKYFDELLCKLKENRIQGKTVYYSAWHVIHQFYNIDVFTSHEALYEIFKPLFSHNKSKEKDILVTYLQEMKVSITPVKELFLFKYDLFNEFASDLIDLLFFYNLHSGCDLAISEFFRGESGHSFPDIFHNRLLSCLNNSKYWGFLPAFDLIMNNQNYFLEYVCNNYLCFSDRFKLTSHGFDQLVRVFDKMESEFLEYQQGLKYEDFESTRTYYSFLDYRIQPNFSRLKFYRDFFTSYNFYIIPTIEVKISQYDFSSIYIRYERDFCASISSDNKKIIIIESSVFFGGRKIEKRSFILTNDNIVYYVDKWRYIGKIYANGTQEIYRIGNINRGNIPLATELTKIDHPKYLISKKSIKNYFIKEAKKSKFSVEVQSSTKKATTFLRYYNQQDKDKRKHILSYLIQSGSHLDFIETLCDDTSNPEIEWQCHELLLQFLIKNSKELILSDPIWRSYHVMINVFAETWFDTNSKAKVIASRHEKLKKIIDFITSHLPMKIDTVPPVFNYLADCFLSQREDCLETDIKEHLLSIIGWGESLCVSFAQAILICPFLNSEDEQLRQRLYTELLSLLYPDKSEMKKLPPPPLTVINKESKYESKCKVDSSSSPSLFTDEFKENIPKRRIQVDQFESSLLEVKQKDISISSPSSSSIEKIIAENSNEKQALSAVRKFIKEKESKYELDSKKMQTLVVNARQKKFFELASELCLLAKNQECKELIHSFQEDLEKISKINTSTDQKQGDIERLSAENLLIVLQDNQRELARIIQELQNIIPGRQTLTVHQEKIDLFKSALNLYLSDHFIRNIAISKELADAAFSLKTRALMGGFSFVVGQLLPIPFIGLATTLVTEGAKYAMQKQKRTAARELCFEMTTVTQAALFVDCLVHRMICRYQLFISQLDPLATTVFAECLVRRAFLYLQSEKPDLTQANWAMIADYLVMGAGIWNASQDSLECAEDDNDVLLFYVGNERRYVTVNYVCHQSPMVTWESSRDEYYQISQVVKNKSKLSINLPVNYISPFEINHRGLTSSTKKWERRLPIPPYVLSKLDMRMELEKTKAELKQAHVTIKELQEQIHSTSSVPIRSISSTKGFGTFDRRPVSSQPMSSSSLVSANTPTYF